MEDLILPSVGDTVIQGPYRTAPISQTKYRGYLGHVTKKYNGRDDAVHVRWIKSDRTNAYYNTIKQMTLIKIDSRLEETELSLIYHSMVDQLAEKIGFDQSTWSQFMLSYQKLNQEGISLVPLLGKTICNLLNDDLKLTEDSLNLSNPKLSLIKLYQPYCHKVLVGYVFCSDKIGIELIKKTLSNSRVYLSQNLNCLNLKNQPKEIRLFLRDHLLIQHQNDSDDWFGYHQLWNHEKASQSHLQPLDCTKNCVFCEEPLSKEETEYLQTLKADCGCHYHLECTIDLGLSISKVAREDVKMVNLSCLGCQSEMTTEFYRNVLTIIEYQKFQVEQRPKKVADLVSFFNVEGNLIEFVENLLKKDSFREEIDLLNRAVMRKIVLKNALWVDPCPKCEWNLLIDPEEENFNPCPNPNCNHSFLIRGTTKKAKDDEARPALIELMKNSRKSEKPNMGYCKKCFKVINRSQGCDDMRCTWCNTRFNWTRDHKESDYSKIHY